MSGSIEQILPWQRENEIYYINDTSHEQITQICFHEEFMVDKTGQIE